MRWRSARRATTSGRRVPGRPTARRAGELGVLRVELPASARRATPVGETEVDGRNDGLLADRLRAREPNAECSPSVVEAVGEHREHRDRDRRSVILGYQLPAASLVLERAPPKIFSVCARRNCCRERPLTCRLVPLARVQQHRRTRGPCARPLLLRSSPGRRRSRSSQAKPRTSRKAPLLLPRAPDRAAVGRRRAQTIVLAPRAGALGQVRGVAARWPARARHPRGRSDPLRAAPPTRAARAPPVGRSTPRRNAASPRQGEPRLPLHHAASPRGRRPRARPPRPRLAVRGTAQGVVPARRWSAGCARAVRAALAAPTAGPRRGRPRPEAGE